MQVPERTEDGGNPMMHFHASQRGGSWWIVVDPWIPVWVGMLAPKDV